jgi:hypothetical protein
MPDEKITLHRCVVCNKGGTNLSLVIVRDEESGEVEGAVCRDCVQQEQVRKEKEDE